MFEHYNQETTFSKVEENKTFIHKALFGQPILYKKIKRFQSVGVDYNAEQVKPGKKKYEYFEGNTTVKVIGK